MENLKALILLFVFIIVPMWLLMSGTGDRIGSSAQKVKHVIGDRVEIASETWACDKAARSELGQQHDRDAFKTLMLRFHRSGRCLPLQPGSVVDVIGVALFDGGTEIRMKGKPERWWVTTGVLDKTGRKIGTWGP